MTSISKVALAGATGNLGPAILDQLLHAGFKVTVLTRASSTHTFPSSVTVAKVDYESLDSLIPALKGQDAVVSTLGSLALAIQTLLVEAAAKANVKRFIPSEFGSNTLNPKNAALPVFAPKIAVLEALKKEVASGTLSYTLIHTGPFFDWGMDLNFPMSPKTKTISLYDGGDRLYSTTTLPSIGKAVVGVLKHPDETKNRAVRVQDAALSLKQLAAIGKKAVGSEGWKEEVVSINEIVEQSWAELKKPQPNPANFVFNFIRASIWGEGHGGHWEKTDNELLGLKEKTEAEILEIVKSKA